MSPVHEVAVRFTRALRGVVVAGPDSPPPAPPPPEARAPEARTPEPPAVDPPPAPPPEPEAAPPRQEDLDLQAFEAALRGIRDAADQLGPQYQGMLWEMRQAAVELAVAVAGRLLLDKALAGDFPLEALVHHVVDRLPVRRNVIAYLHPEDLTLLRQRLGGRIVVGDDSAPATRPEGPAGQVFAHGGEVVAFHPDPDLQRGSCRAEAAGVSVLADLHKQLANLRQTLLESLTPCSG